VRVAHLAGHLSVSTAAEFATLEIAFAFSLVVAVRTIIQIIENGFTVSGRCDSARSEDENSWHHIVNGSTHTLHLRFGGRRVARGWRNERLILHLVAVQTDLDEKKTARKMDVIDEPSRRSQSKQLPARRHTVEAAQRYANTRQRTRK